MSNMKGIDYLSDVTEAAGAMGVISGMLAAMKTNRYTESVLKYTHGVLTESFNEHMDQLAEAMPDSLSHVYDWRMNGYPAGRLWVSILRGQGANRDAVFDWIASEQPIRTPEERHADSGDPMSLVDESDIAKLSDRKYIFQWKAPVMEYGLPVNIYPVHVQNLFIPTGDAANPFAFSKHHETIPGGPHIGKFTEAWTSWWATAAPTIFDETVKKTVEHDLGRMDKESVTSRVRKKSISLSTVADAEAAFLIGKTFAEKFVLEQADTYGRGKYAILRQLEEERLAQSGGFSV